MYDEAAFFPREIAFVDDDKELLEMRYSPQGLVGALVALAAVLPSTGCTDLGVGRKCLPPGDVAQVQISAPALECMSRLCYLKADDKGTLQRSVCTARCVTDDDCKGALTGQDTGLCGSSFVCAVASSVNLGSKEQNFACQGICICKDDLEKGKNADSSSGNPCCPQGCEGKCPASLPRC